MLKKRIIPCLDVKDGRVVKGVNFEGLRDAGDPVEVAARYDADGADELCFLDITASAERRGTLLELVERTAERVFCPLTVGGGVRSVEDLRELLVAGADKASINTAALRDPELVARCAGRVGSQCVVVAIDAKLRRADDGIARQVPDWAAERPELHAAVGEPEVFAQGGRIPTGLSAVAWAREAVRLGAGELLLTSIDRDGTGAGYDLPLLRAIVDAVPVPVIASGGAGSLADLAAALGPGGADAALAASIFHYGRHTVPEARAFLAARGIAVRPAPGLAGAPRGAG